MFPLVVFPLLNMNSNDRSWPQESDFDDRDANCCHQGHLWCADDQSIQVTLKVLDVKQLGPEVSLHTIM